MSSDQTDVSVDAPGQAATPSSQPANVRRDRNPKVPSHEALAIASADGKLAYGDLSRFRIEITLEDDGWHVAHFVNQRPGTRIAGGGPHYVISADTGEIVSKKYYQ